MTLIGKVLAGRYEILEEVGSGGMAVVYKAKCQLLNRYVAVKVLRPDLQNDDEFVRRFNVEAQAAASLTHSNIVSIYDVGNEDGLHYIVMEYIEGMTLKEYIEKRLILPWREAADYAIQIAKGLEQAHRNSIIHRDVKPHNIIMTADGVMKVTDFGIARANVQSTVTCEDSAIGSVHYISPEQARGGYTDERSDIYSLGVVLYEMLTGKVPFDSDRPVTVAIMHLQEKPVMPREHNLSIPRALENIVLKAMSKEISARYKNVSEMISELQDVLNDPSRAVITVDDDEDNKRGGMEETKKMPLVGAEGLDILLGTGDTVIEPETVEEKVDVPEKKDDEKMTKKSSKKSAARVKPQVDKKKEKKVAMLAVVSAIAAVLIIAGVMAYALGIFDFLFPKSQDIVIPNLLGKTKSEAQMVLAGIKDENGNPVRFNIIGFSNGDEDAVITSQDPADGSKIKPKDNEEFIIKVQTKSPKRITLADYTNEDKRIAEEKLKNQSLRVAIEEQAHETIAKDLVVGQYPSPGSQVEEDTEVTLYVSSGPDREDKEEVTNCVNLSSSVAEQRLKAAGFKVRINGVYDDKAVGTVISQSPAPYTYIEKGGVVTLNVSKGPEPKEPSEGENTEGEGENNGGETPEVVTKKSTILTLYGPRDKDSALVEVFVNGKKTYSKNIAKGDHAEVKLEAAANSIEVEIFYDGVSMQKKTVSLN